MPADPICVPCAMGNCEYCEGEMELGCGCASLKVHTREKLAQHAGCVGSNPYCPLLSHILNADAAQGATHASD